MTVLQNSNVIQEREYYSASECVATVQKAKEYYQGRNEEVEILMKDKNKALVIKIDTKNIGESL